MKTSEKENRGKEAEGNIYISFLKSVLERLTSKEKAEREATAKDLAYWEGYLQALKDGGEEVATPELERATLTDRLVQAQNMLTEVGDYLKGGRGLLSGSEMGNEVLEYIKGFEK